MTKKFNPSRLAQTKAAYDALKKREKKELLRTPKVQKALHRAKANVRRRAIEARVTELEKKIADIKKQLLGEEVHTYIRVGSSEVTNLKVTKHCRKRVRVSYDSAVRIGETIIEISPEMESSFDNITYIKKTVIL